MIFILHDNETWLGNLRENLNLSKLEYTEWDLSEGTNILGNIDFNKPPPEGIYYNRVSASGFSRNARYSLEYSLVIIQWLERYNRKVINGSNSIAIELNKVKQFLELEKCGLKSPKIYLATNKKEILEVAEREFLKLDKKCIIKDNRSGSGISVKLIENIDELNKYINSSEYSRSIDGITLIQQYIESPEPYVTRMEYVNGKLVYVLRVNTSNGFNICPADKCNIGIGNERFKLIKANDFQENELISKYLKLQQKNGILVCGIEYIQDKEGVKWTYDINCNTNYNLSAEKKADIPNYGNKELIKLFKYLLN